MLQQTGVKTVGPYFAKFLARWPDVAALGRASLDDVLRMWAGLGYYSRARNLHACAVAVLREHGGVFPDTEAGLRALPGIGPYTAAAIAAIAFGRHDHAGRRQYRARGVAAVRGRGAAAAGQAADQAIGGDAARRATSRAGDSAQALMDLGAIDLHAEEAGLRAVPAERRIARRVRAAIRRRFRARRRRRPATLRRGAAFVVTRGDEILVRTRAEKGLLGGMTEVPRLGLARRRRTTRVARKQAPALQGRCALASQGGRGHPRLHAFSAGACGLHRARRRAHARAGGHALGARSRRCRTRRCRM